MQAEKILDIVCRVAAAIPADVAWFVVVIDSNHLALLDGRFESSFPIAEGVASQFGEIVATASHPTHDGDWLALLVRVDDAEHTEGRLRASYLTATEPISGDSYFDDERPF